MDKVGLFQMGEELFWCQARLGVDRFSVLSCLANEKLGGGGVGRRGAKFGGCGESGAALRLASDESRQMTMGTRRRSRVSPPQCGTRYNRKYSIIIFLCKRCSDRDAVFLEPFLYLFFNV